MIRVLRPIHGGSTALADFLVDGVASYGRADQLFSGHARETNRNRQTRTGYKQLMFTSSIRWLAVLLLATTLTSACASSGVREGNPRALPAEGAPPPDVSELYRQIGLMAAPNPLSF